MMSEATLLESRVDKLEQDNRRLKLTVGALLLVLVAVPLIGAVMPQQIPEVIEARAFRTIDENGIERASIRTGGIIYQDENGNARAMMWPKGFYYFDENFIQRARLGSVETITPSTGATTTYPGQVALYDADGTVLWSALR